jgi:hypothetical protein
MTFNDFRWQVSYLSLVSFSRTVADSVQIQNPLKISIRDRAMYAFRFSCSFVTMEIVLHTMYVVAIKDTKAWEGDSPADLSMIGFWNLVIVWHKVSPPYSMRETTLIEPAITAVEIFQIMGFAGWNRST